MYLARGKMVKGVIQFSANADRKSVERARRRVASELNKLIRIAENTPWDAARIAQLSAKGVAPYERGYIFRAIKMSTDKNQAMVYVDQDVLFENPSNINRFNYALHMHVYNGDMGRGIKIKSGEPRFLSFGRKRALDFVRQDIKIKLKR